MDRDNHDDREVTFSAAPRTFAETLARVEELILQDFDREIVEKQLYYHGRDHADTVRRRAARLLNAVAPYLNLPADSLARLDGLLSLCAAAHDAIQIFEPQERPHGSRRREPGVSEAVTIERLIAHIQSVQCLPAVPDSARFTAEELQTVRDAINATVCLDDASDQVVYQPALYRTGKPPPLVAQLLAMADIGSLGMDGIEAYNEEGSLLFLEENPDTIPFIRGEGEPFQRADPELRDNIRHRLLRRARFQVRFARSRLTRYSREIACLPAKSLPVLKARVWPYLTEDTVRLIESTIPTGDHTPLETFIDFFRFERYL
jgi:hypothetical protein